MRSPGNQSSSPRQPWRGSGMLKSPSNPANWCLSQRHGVRHDLSLSQRWRGKAQLRRVPESPYCPCASACQAKVRVERGAGGKPRALPCALACCADANFDNIVVNSSASITVECQPPTTRSDITSTESDAWLAVLPRLATLVLSGGTVLWLAVSLPRATVPVDRLAGLVLVACSIQLVAPVVTAGGNWHWMTVWGASSARLLALDLPFAAGWVMPVVWGTHQPWYMEYACGVGAQVAVCAMVASVPACVRVCADRQLRQAASALQRGTEPRGLVARRRRSSRVITDDAPAGGQQTRSTPEPSPQGVGASAGDLEAGASAADSWAQAATASPADKSTRGHPAGRTSPAGNEDALQRSHTVQRHVNRALHLTGAVYVCVVHVRCGWSASHRGML